MTLPLDKLREVIAYNPWHFWGYANDRVPVTSGCNTIIREYAWQAADGAGRVEMRRAINDAENRMIDALGYRLRSEYIVESVPIRCITHWLDGGLGGGWMYNRLAEPGIIKLGSGLIHNIQTETLTLLGQVTNLQIVDTDGDGVNDWFTAQIVDGGLVTDLTTAGAAFLPADLPASKQDAPVWIEPVYISRLDANTIKIAGNSWLICPPKKYEGYALNIGASLDPNDNANYVTSFNFYYTVVTGIDSVTLTYLDDSNNLQLLAMGAGICDARSGFITVNNHDVALPCNCNDGRSNQLLQVSYRAGDIVNANDWNNYIVYFALALLRKRLCACDNANREVLNWQMRLDLPVGPQMARINIDPNDLANPFGPENGAVYTWRKVKEKRLTRAVFAG